MDKVRIDKWLWAVRIFKSRTEATEACAKGRVTMGDLRVKASHDIKIGDTISVRFPPIDRLYRVKGLAEKRMGAPMTVDFMEEITPEDRLALLKGIAANYERRDPGIGRPTKKDRRMIERLKDFEEE